MKMIDQKGKKAYAERDFQELIEEPEKHVLHEGFIPHSIPKNF